MNGIQGSRQFTHALLLMVAIGVLFALPAGGAVAQEATPSAEEQTWLAYKPDPSLCLAEQRPVEDAVKT